MRRTLLLLAALAWFAPITANADPITFGWDFSGGFVDPAGSGTFSGRIVVQTDDPFAGIAGLEAVDVHTSASGAFAEARYVGVVAVAPNNTLIFADDYLNPTAVLHVSCGNSSDFWWAAPVTNSSCVVIDHQNFEFAQDYKNLVGPNAIRRTSGLVSVTLAAQAIPEPATLALLGLGLACLGFSRRRSVVLSTR